MKTVLFNTGLLINKADIANEAVNILDKNASKSQQYQADGEEIIEYDLENENNTCIWTIDSVKYNNDGSIHSITIDC